MLMAMSFGGFREKQIEKEEKLVELLKKHTFGLDINKMISDMPFINSLEKIRIYNEEKEIEARVQIHLL